LKERLNGQGSVFNVLSNLAKNIKSLRLERNNHEWFCHSQRCPWSEIFLKMQETNSERLKKGEREQTLSTSRELPIVNGMIEIISAGNCPAIKEFSKENPLSSPDFSFDSTKSVWTAWDIGADGTAIGFFQTHEVNATFIDFEEGKSILDIAHYANKTHILPWDAFRKDLLNIPLFGNSS
jgi:hypothetical protein